MKQTLVLIAVLLLLTTSAHAQVGSWQMADPVVNDVRAQAMGHCELFGARDASAMFSNPAWMGATRDLSIEVGASTRFGSVEDEETNDFYDGGWEKNYTGEIRPDFAAAALPIRIKHVPISFGAGIGMWTMHELGWNTETTYTGSSVEITETREYTGPLQVAGIGLSAGLFDMIYAGISTGSYVGGEVESSYAYEENSNTGTLGYESKTTATPEFTVATASIVLMPNKKFKLGFMARPSYEITLGDIVEDDVTPRQDVTFTMPSVTGVSVALSPDDMVEFLVEYQTRSFSELAYQQGDNPEIESDLDNGSVFRAGAKLGVFHVGYFSEDIAQAKYDDTAPVSRDGWTFGLGHRGQTVSFHVAAEYATLKQEATSLTPSNGTRDITTTNWRIGVGLGVHFF